jgi:hypothetical protein
VLTTSCNWCLKDNQNPKPFVCKSCTESYGDSYAESDTCRRPLTWLLKKLVVTRLAILSRMSQHQSSKSKSTTICKIIRPTRSRLLQFPFFAAGQSKHLAEFRIRSTTVQLMQACLANVDFYQGGFILGVTTCTRN